MLRDSDGDIGGGKFVRSGSYALRTPKAPVCARAATLYHYLSKISFDRFDEEWLGKFAEGGGPASRNLQAKLKGNLLSISLEFHAYPRS